MAVSTAFDQFETILRENLGDAVINMVMEELDDPALRMMTTFQPLGLGGRQSSGTDIWEARRKVKLSRGGMVTGGTWAGNTISSLGDNDDLPIGQEASARAPDPEAVPLTQYVTLAVTLKRIFGNVTVNMSQILADLLGDGLEELATGHLEDAVFQVRKNMLSWFYSDGTSMIATADGAYSIDTTAGGVAVGLKSAPYNRFIKGQRYVFYDNSAGWSSTKTRLGGIARCVKIDDNNKQPYFEMEAGEATATLAVDDVIALHGTNSGTTSLVPNGIEGMFVESGAFYGLSDITDYPEFIAYVEGDEDNPVEPEPDRIAKLVNRIKKAGKAPPTMLVSESALSTQYAYTEKAGFAMYPVPQRLPNPNGGVGQPVFQHGTLVMPWEDSEYIRPGMLWGAAPDTIMKFQPGGADTIRWWNGNGPGAGVGKIFVPVMDGTQQTELWQAPFETHVDFLVVNPKRNFRYVGLTTQETA